MPPMRLGIKKTVLKALVPLSPLVRSRASRNARMFIVITDTTVNLTVSLSEFINVLSSVNILM